MDLTCYKRSKINLMPLAVTVGFAIAGFLFFRLPD
jgi:hypothetical protein